MDSNFGAKNVVLERELLKSYPIKPSPSHVRVWAACANAYRCVVVFVVLVGEEVTQQHLHEAQRVVGPVGVLPFRRRVARPMREHLRVYRQWRNDGVAAASDDGGPLVVGGPPTVLEFLVINFSVCLL